MKVKLTPSLCYLAGIQSRFKEENGAVGIKTGLNEVEQRFIELLINEFKIPSNKILINEQNNSRHIFFYHSKLNKQIAYIKTNQNKLFRLPTLECRNYLAGIFDGSGHIKENVLFIGKLSRADEVLLETLGIHIEGNRVLSPKVLLSLIKNISVLSNKINT